MGSFPATFCGGRDTVVGPLCHEWGSEVACRRLAYRATGSPVALILTIGVIGGVVISSLAGARATQNSDAAMVARSNPSAVNVFLGALISTLRLTRLVDARHVEAARYSFNAIPLRRSSAPPFSKPLTQGEVVPNASLGGQYFSQHRVSDIAGHMADRRPWRGGSPSSQWPGSSSACRPALRSVAGSGRSSLERGTRNPTHPSVLVGSIVLVPLGARVLVNVVAALLGRC